MRFLTPTERGYLTDPEGHWAFAYLEVTNFDGTWINVGNVAVGTRTADFLNTFSVSDNIDANTLSMSATLLREVGAYSLVPFRSDSPLNVDDASAYSPLLDLHRSWRLWGVILPIDTFPADPSDYREWWTGIIDRIDIQGDPAIISVQGRGMEADIIDARIAFVDNTADPPVAISQDTPKTYASGDLPDVLQAILDEELGSGAVPLTVDGSAPVEFINGWNQTSDVGAMDLLSQTAGVATGLVRYKYDSSDVLSFTLFSPNRTPSTPDWSTDGGEYEKLDVGIGLNDVRNYVYVRYFDNTFGMPLVVTSPNASPATATSASIARFRLRSMSIDLAASTQVNAQTPAGNLADAARSDLEFPIIEHTLTGRFWFAELGDYVQILANGIHYDQDQFGGITSIQHTFANGELKSVLGMRAKPAGRYRGWLDFGPGAPRTPFTPAVTQVSATFFETTFLLTRTPFVKWVANVNQFARSVKAELFDINDLTTVLDTQYANVVGGIAQGLFSGVSRDMVYYVLVTPYSGALSGGLPTGIVGTPGGDSTFVQFEVPSKPQYDSDIATINSDIAAETAARIAGDAAQQAYTDAKVAGLSWKQAVRAATTSAGTLASSFENGDAIDGVTLATGDRILVKNQAAPAENGIYIVNASGAPTRATDADTGAELVNATCYVSQGTTNADTQWTCTTNATITLGSTSLAFAQLATGSVGTQTANTVYAGPTSGGVALPTFRALVAADIPSLDAAKIVSGVLDVLRLGTGTPSSATYLRGDGTWSAISASTAWRVDVSRSVSVTVDDTVEIGHWGVPEGMHRITVRVNQANSVITKGYLFSSTFGSTGGAWQLVYPNFSSINGSADLELEVKVDTGNAFFRLRRTAVGVAVGGITAFVTLEYGGDAAPTWTSTTTTSTSAITAHYADRFLLSGLAGSGASDGQFPVWDATNGKWVPSTNIPGNPTTTTQAAGNNSTRIATTSFVKAAIDAVLNGVSSAFDTLSEIATELGLKAPLASPALTGAPTAPTQIAGDNSTKISTTAYVDGAISGGSSGGVIGAIPDLIFWFESDNIVGTSGFPVPVLRNRTPAYLGANANGVGTGTTGSAVAVASTTLNSLPVVNFAGNTTGRFKNVADLTGIFNGGATFVVVFNLNSLAAVNSFWSGATGSLQLVVTTGGKLQLVRTNTAIIATDTTTLSVGTWYQATITYNPSSGAYAFRVARAASSSGTNAVAVNVGNNGIGYNVATNAEDLNAKVAVILAAARVLSGGEITTAETYLNTKWGV